MAEQSKGQFCGPMMTNIELTYPAKLQKLLHQLGTRTKMKMRHDMKEQYKLALCGPMVTNIEYNISQKKHKITTSIRAGQK